jgi:hypothetical protein
LFLLSASADIDAWSEQHRNPSEAETAAVMSQLEWAVRMADADSSIHENLARLSLLRATSISDVAQRQQVLHNGLNEIHIALALSPASPYHWTILLMLKRDLGEYDAEFRYALHRAVELGPWEPTLLVAQADVGLSAWNSMPVEEQAIIQQVFVRGIQHQEQAMQGVAQSHNSACVAGAVCQ